MICPYCVEDVPAGSRKHDACRMNEGQEFPKFYVKFHGDEDDTDPIIFSVVGSVGHGKTVFLCALFDFLDNHLTDGVWPSFFNHVLDQDSLSRLNVDRHKLRQGELPQPTKPTFPRPGIFRLTNMPSSAGNSNMPPLEDTTVLIYDPPGEAFINEENITTLASFVKRSSCVLFLIDLSGLGESIPDKMAELLDTYLLGMETMGIERQSQHLIVVYTKSDEMKVSVPEFAGYLEKEPKLKAYLNERLPPSLADPHEHLDRLEQISQLLEKFTRAELKAGKFIHEARYWFRSVSYTAVSSLGSAPEGSGASQRLKVKMSPRGVADPLLYVLAKSIKVMEEPPPSWWRQLLARVGINAVGGALLAGLSGAALLAGAIFIFGFYNVHFKRAYACEQKKDYACAVENYTRAINSSPDYAEAYARRGWAYVRQDKYDEAIADCETAVKLKPNLAEAFACRGTASYFKKNVEQALGDCNKAVELWPEYAEAYNCRGVAYQHQKNYTEALKNFDKAIALKPDYSRAYVNRGITYLNQGNREQALKEYDRAIELEPDLASAYSNRGLIHVSEGQYDLAIKDFDKAIVLKPDFVNAYNGRATAYTRQAKYPEAIRDFDTAIRLKPDYVEAYRGRGAAYTLIGNYSQGVRDFGEVVRLEPGNDAAYVNRGEAYSADGKYTQAIEDYNRALELKPDSVDAHFKRGGTYFLSGKYGQAVGDYSKVLELKPDYVDAYFERGNAYLSDGKYDSAINDYNAAAKLSPENAEPVYNRGIVYALKGNYEQAIKEYEAATKLDPELDSRPNVNYSNAFFQRGLSHDRKGDAGDYKDYEYYLAVSDYTEAIKLNPGSFSPYFRRGLIYIGKEKYDEAIKDYNKAIEIRPRNADAYNNRGVAYRKLGKTDLAIADYRRAVQLDPTNVTARDNLASLENR